MKFQSELTAEILKGFEGKASPACRACGGPCGGTPYVVADQSGMAADLDPHASSMSAYYKCIQCGSLNDINISQTYYSGDIDIDFISYYADTGAGIAEMIEPVSQYLTINPDARMNTGLRFLEIGCGVGYTIDFCRRILGWEAVGLEPGQWGRYAESLLGVNVEQEYLGNGSSYDNEVFDIVYASEVVEHVIDPLVFLETLKKVAGKSLDIILSTPNSDYITQSANAADVYSLLFPGEHKIIFSAKGIRAILERAGFTNISIKARQGGKNLLVYASFQNRLYGVVDQVKEGNETDNEIMDGSALVEEYYKLVLSSEKGSFPLPLIKRGLFYRLFKAYVNTNRLDKAKELLYNAFTYDDTLSPVETIRSKQGNNFDIGNNDAFLFCNLLRSCLRTLYKEWACLDLSGNSYPVSVTSCHKLLGFYVCTLIHHFISPGNAEGKHIYKHVSLFLASLLSFIEYINSFPHSYYYLELMSLRGPALSSLVLANAKLDLHFELDTLYKFFQESEFAVEFPQSYQEIIHQCHIHPYLGKQACDTQKEILNLQAKLANASTELEAVMKRLIVAESECARVANVSSSKVFRYSEKLVSWNAKIKGVWR
jgi:hypothetical protein